MTHDIYILLKHTVHPAHPLLQKTRVTVHGYSAKHTVYVNNIIIIMSQDCYHWNIIHTLSSFMVDVSVFLVS